MEGPGGLVLVCALAMIAFRPADLPIMARSAGRAVGTGVRVLHRTREAALDTFKQSTAGHSSSMQDARRSVSRSVKTLDSISERIRREMGPLSFNPRHLVNFTADETDPSKLSRAPDSDGTSGVSPQILAPAAMQPKEITSDSALAREPKLMYMDRKAILGSAPESGADIIASVIEESAFAKQRVRITGPATAEDRTE